MIYYLFKWIFILSYRFIFLIYELISNNKKRKNNLLKNFDILDGYEFETFCRDLLLSNGFRNAEVTRGSGDQGIDVLAFNGNKKVGFQCKNYSSKVSNTAVQEAYAGQSFYGLDEVYVLTNNYFTDSAKQLALSTGVILLDRDYILSSLQNKRKTLSFDYPKQKNRKEQQKNELELQTFLRDTVESYYNIYEIFIDSLKDMIDDGDFILSDLSVETSLMDNTIKLVEPYFNDKEATYTNLLCSQVLTISYAFKTLNLATLANNLDVVFETLDDLAEIFTSYYEDN